MVFMKGVDLFEIRYVVKNKRYELELTQAELAKILGFNTCDN